MKIQYFLKRLKHKCLTHQFNPTHVGWVELIPTHMMGCIRLA